MPEFDYVIVGAGTAGCVLAARLSENPANEVLLVEAGRPSGPEAIKTWYLWPTLAGSDIDWCHWTEPQPGLADTRLLLSQGKVLGGSSATNGTMHVRGRPTDYDAWAGFAQGWDHASLLPYFRRSETASTGNPELRGTDGPMRVAALPLRTELGEALHRAAIDAGYPETDDLNGAHPDGVGRNEHNVVAGVRQSAADAYLGPARDRKNLTVLTDATARWLQFAYRRCTGVLLQTADGLQSFSARIEVVVAAGAIGSPHLLMASGIGPADHLTEHGVPVLVDAPQVGSNLYDHVLSGVVYQSPDESSPQPPQTFVVRPPGDAGGPHHGDVLMVCVSVPNHSPALAGPINGYTIAFGLMRPLSRGTVRLANADPTQRPLVNPRYLSVREDIDRMIQGLRMAREVGDQPALDAWRKEEALPGPDVQNYDDCLRYLQRSATPFFHPAGTCRLGDDPNSVVDGELRLRGVEGVRVVDASVMPAPICANTNATVLAIAERAADLIDDSRVRPGPTPTRH
ncbi:GMC family oxidoreductase [Cryptosporangium sp. NPDC051539]|uniref:GMC family oxidoreductase n=1 Tax=Cryptosporangium sp. NPDC051539 TaxID=3363962 RepID=UPI0037B25EB0